MPASVDADAPPAAPVVFDYSEGPPPPEPEPHQWPLKPRLDDRALLVWLVLLFVLGVGGLLLRQEELSALVALAGLFVAAQAADLEREWRFLYLALAWIVPVGGAFVFGSIVQLLRSAELAAPLKLAMIGLSVAGGLISLLLWWQPIADPLTRALFRDPRPGHALRLAMRLVVLSLLLAIPGWFALRDTIFDMLSSGAPVLTQDAFAGSLVGYIAVALASVGFMIRRSWPATLERLGLTRLRWSDALVVLAGAGALFALNTGADWLQHRAFPDLWQRDNAMNDSMMHGLGLAQTIGLGVSAGVGEEITMRGALQPRLGILLTSLVFASLHIQYSWFGMVVIFALGATLGGIRRSTSTTVAMLVHAAYDMVAVFTH